MSSVSSAKRCFAPGSAQRARAHGKARSQLSRCAFPHVTVRQARLGKLSANASTLTRGGLRIVLGAPGVL